MTRSLILCVATILILSVTAPASEISYQGMLTDGSGVIVPDGNYSIYFALFDDSVGGTKLWEETHPVVPVTNGMFTVLLGSIDPIDEGWYEGDMPNCITLEINVNGDGPISPRSMITSAPQAMSAYRLRGDIKTMPGILEVHPPDPGLAAPVYPGFRVKVDSTGSNWRLVPPQPIIPEDSCGGMQGTVSTEMVALQLNGSMGWGDPCDTLPEVRLAVDSEKASLLLRRHADGSYVDISANLDASLSLVGAQPPNNQPHQLHMNADSGSSNLWLGSVDPTGGTLPVISMHANAGAVLNLGYASGNPPDDGQPVPDNTKPGVVMATSPTMGSFELRGPDDGTGTVHTIAMMVDGAQARLGIGINTSSEALFVVGNIIATGSITAITGTKMKRNIETVESALDKVGRLRGVTYDMRRDEYPELGFSDKRQLGFLAEEVEDVIPQVVLNSGDMKAVDYGRLTPLLVEAIKEQQTMIKSLQQELLELKAIIEGQ